MYNISIQIDGSSDIIVICVNQAYASEYLLACIDDAVDNGEVDDLESYLCEQYGEGVFKIEWTIDEDVKRTVASGVIEAPKGYFAADPTVEIHYPEARDEDDAIELFFDNGEPWVEGITANEDLSEDEIEKRLLSINEMIISYRRDLTGEKVWG